MAVYHDEIEIEDMEFDEQDEKFYYPCPCGDKFELALDDLENGEDIATCPSCSLIIRVIFTMDDVEKYRASLASSAQSTGGIGITA